MPELHLLHLTFALLPIKGISLGQKQGSRLASFVLEPWGIVYERWLKKGMVIAA